MLSRKKSEGNPASLLSCLRYIVPRHPAQNRIDYQTFIWQISIGGQF